MSQGNIDDQIDRVYDMLLIATTAACFLSAILFMGKATIDTLNGWHGVTGLIYNAGLSVVIGIIVGVFFIYVKSMGGK